MKSTSTVLTAAIIAVIAAYGTVKMVAPQSGTTVQTEKKESVYERVMRTGTLRCGYTPFAPLVTKDANTGKLSGIIYDLVEEMGRQLSLKVEWTTEVSPAGMFEGFSSNQYDAICAGYFRNPARALRSDFTDPLFFLSSSVYVRKDDSRFDSDIYSLNSSDYSFAMVDGEITNFTVKEEFPKARITSLPEIMAADPGTRIMNVMTKKDDALILEDTQAVNYSQKNPDQIKALFPPIRVQGSYILIPQNEYPLKRMLDAAIANLNETGTVKRKILQYTDGYGYYLPSDPFKLEPLKK
jgi:ABC-type amino acid transport substrate-binding protein